MQLTYGALTNTTSGTKSNKKLNNCFNYTTKIKAIALYIINFVEIAYHPLGEWHIIIAKEIQHTVDEMHLR